MSTDTRTRLEQIARSYSFETVKRHWVRLCTIAERMERMSLRELLRNWAVYVLVLTGFVLGSSMLVSREAHAETYANQLAIQTILLEARGEGLAGMRAVAEVIKNRVQRDLQEDMEGYMGYGRFEVAQEAAVVNIVTAPWQFSCWNSKAWASRQLRLVEQSKHYEHLYQVASRAWLDEDLSTSVSGANLYCRYDCWPSWRKSRKVQYVGRVGNHVFYKE